jgi:hypothetical protein
MSSNVIFLSINRGFGCEASWKMLIVHRLAFFPFPFPDLLLEFAFSYFFDREPETASNLRSSPGDGAQRSARGRTAGWARLDPMDMIRAL